MSFGPDTTAMNSFDSLRGFRGLSFNPRPLIQVVNRLHGRGREGALEFLYERSGSGGAQAENVLLAARLLFEPSPGKALPPLELGKPDLEDPGKFPLFPLVLYRDIPFLLITGYILGGQLRPPTAYLETCEREAIFRLAPLRPDDDPLRSVNEFLSSDRWKNARPEPWRDSMLRLQVLAALDDIYTVPKSEKEILASASDLPLASKIWNRHLQEFKRLHVAWNRLTNTYEVGAGAPEA
jgi:hypothetical protein